MKPKLESRTKLKTAKHSLLDIPFDCLCYASGFFERPSTVNSLIRTNKYMYTVFNTATPMSCKNILFEFSRAVALKFPWDADAEFPFVKKIKIGRCFEEDQEEKIAKIVQDLYPIDGEKKHRKIDVESMIWKKFPKVFRQVTFLDISPNWRLYNMDECEGEFENGHDELEDSKREDLAFERVKNTFEMIGNFAGKLNSLIISPMDVSRLNVQSFKVLKNILEITIVAPFPLTMEKMCGENFQFFEKIFPKLESLVFHEIAYKHCIDNDEPSAPFYRLFRRRSDIDKEVVTKPLGEVFSSLKLFKIIRCGWGMASGYLITKNSLKYFLEFVKDLISRCEFQICDCMIVLSSYDALVLKAKNFMIGGYTSPASFYHFRCENCILCRKCGDTISKKTYSANSMVPLGMRDTGPEHICGHCDYENTMFYCSDCLTLCDCCLEEGRAVVKKVCPVCLKKYGICGSCHTGTSHKSCCVCETGFCCRADCSLTKCFNWEREHWDAKRDLLICQKCKPKSLCSVCNGMYCPECVDPETHLCKYKKKFKEEDYEEFSTKDDFHW